MYTTFFLFFSEFLVTMYNHDLRETDSSHDFYQIDSHPTHTGYSSRIHYVPSRPTSRHQHPLSRRDQISSRLPPREHPIMSRQASRGQYDMYSQFPPPRANLIAKRAYSTPHEHLNADEQFIEYHRGYEGRPNSKHATSGTIREIYAI